MTDKTDTEATATGDPEAPPAPPAPPSDYRIAVPEGWERVVLDPDRWPHRIDKLVNRGLRRTKATPQLKAALADRLREQAEAAHTKGGVEMYLVNQVIGQVPVTAGLVVTVLQPPPGSAGGDLADIALSLGTGGADADADVTMADLPAGPAVRHLYRLRPAPDDPDGNTVPLTHLDVYLAVPRSDQRLLLSFSTPTPSSMEPLAEALVTLFDSIARTLQWMA
ncbi:hypothetical protein GCM10011579_077190 [Streptomyces albiflavescens]|uniref:Uncharacterized protein n=1 Tax=Streptomyces albiflavescens TaxID=1623582 RepID=A0A917YDQ1_9ACTN|nr:hypothetical protein [Streptomyces albiflavescens]GGN85928.1 hypothetical protein GCM10011579_077190 [Streptomyces albiflavescens]